MQMLQAPAQMSTALDVKFVAESGVFEGYASVFGITDSANDIIAKGAFEKSLARFQSEGRLPPLLWQHDMKEPIGAWREMYEDARGLYVKGELFTADIARAREALRLMRENVVTGLSIGYRVRQSHRDEKSGSRILTDVDLQEVSMVTFPANDGARVSRVKSIFAAGQIPSEREFEAFLRDAGLSRKQAKGMIALGYKSLGDFQDRPRDADDDVSAILSLTDTIKQLT